MSGLLFDNKASNGLFAFVVSGERGSLGATLVGSFAGVIVVVVVAVVAGASEVLLGEGDARGGTVFGGHKGV